MSCCITRDCITSSSRLFLPWWRSHLDVCLSSLTVSLAHVMRGSSSIAGLLQMDVEPLWATGWLTRLLVDCTFTPFQDLILHERSDKAIISVFKPLAPVDTRFSSNSPQLTHTGAYFCFWAFPVMHWKKISVWLLHLFLWPHSCPPQLRFRNDYAGLLTGKKFIF